jgi:ATP-binding cassette subfamily B protein
VPIALALDEGAPETRSAARALWARLRTSRRTAAGTDSRWRGTRDRFLLGAGIAGAGIAGAGIAGAGIAGAGIAGAGIAGAGTDVSAVLGTSLRAAPYFQACVSPKLELAMGNLGRSHFDVGG